MRTRKEDPFISPLFDPRESLCEKVLLLRESAARQLRRMRRSLPRVKIISRHNDLSKRSRRSFERSASTVIDNETKLSLL